MAREIWFDVKHNVLGVGKAYGKHSFNGKPIDAIFGKKAVEAFLGLHKFPEKAPAKPSHKP